MGQNAASAITRNEINNAFPYKVTAPKFPKFVKNYVLFQYKKNISIRLFQEDNWVVPIKMFDPSQDGGATMSCQPYFWAIRWRSNNPDITIRATMGITDSGFSSVSKSAEGGTGFLSGQSCLAPGFKFGRAINGNQGNLVDVNYEYQLWKYRPKI